MKKILFLAIIMALPFATALRGENEGAPFEAESGDASDSPFNQSKFVPDISLMLDGSYVFRNTRNAVYEMLESPEFTLTPGGESWHGHEEPHLRNGFNFNYAEISFYSMVDPYLELFAVCSLSEEHFGLEEAHFTTRSFPLGLQLRAGKFLSGFGRINEQHAHNWDFADQTLVNNAFFGEDGLSEVGVRLTWVAPTDLYLMLGGEALQGTNGRSFGNAKILNVKGTPVANVGNGPNLGVAYLKTSFDIGELTVLAGASAAIGKARINHGLDLAGKSGAAFAGDTRVLGGDITLKYMIDSLRYVSFQGEYLFRHMEGRRFSNDASDEMTRSDMDKRQSGLYAQLTSKFSPRWRCGARYDLLWKNRVRENGVDEGLPENMPRYSGMLEFNPTEFSRFRLQYNFDASKYNCESGAPERKINHEVIIQANLAIGAHGAHSF